MKYYIEEDELSRPEKTGSGMQRITLRDVMELLIIRWYWYLLAIVACVAVVWFYTRTLTRTYRHQAVMLVKTDVKNTGTDVGVAFDLRGGITGSGVDNEMFMLRSYQMVHEVVERLRLDVSYEEEGFFRNTTLYAESPVDMRFTTPYSGYTTLMVTPLDGERYRVSNLQWNGKTIAMPESLAYGDTVRTEAGSWVMEPRPENVEAYKNKEVLVSRVSLEDATRIYKSDISTSLAEKGTTMVQITCDGTNLSRIDAILNTLINVYNETIIKDRNRIAVNTAKFIDERIVVIGNELGAVEEELTGFKQKNNLVSDQPNGGMYMGDNHSVRGEIFQLETERSMAQCIKEYLLDITHKGQPIPNVSGVGDAGVQGQIATYNALLLQRNRLVTESGERNPVVQSTDDNLAEMRQLIVGSIDNYMQGLRLRINRLDEKERQLNADIQGVPEQERQVQGIIRQQSVKETLYTFLLRKREENALQLAITDANTQIVEFPYGSNAPTAPNVPLYLAMAFAVGLLVPLSIQLLTLLWNTSVRGRKDVEDYTTIPVLGEIPALKNYMASNTIVVDEKKNDAISEAFRLLRSNINFVARDAKVFLFTSTLPNEGKSFVSRNLSVALAIAGKRVILVDADLRKRTQSRLAGVDKQEGLSTYLAGQTDDVDSIIYQGAIHPKVDSLFAGVVPPNPSELLMSLRLEQLIVELRERYDYIILDNVPAHAIADAAIISRVADLTLYVIRTGMIDRRYLPELEHLHQEGKFKNLCVVLNACHIEKKKYGYAYGYGYTYGYGYK
ncbi:MAG: polysaccharide biosynthesis tyrosine autokinase [Mediterranea sp.]|jgi:capsular exopolysaccharide synthesis family protein|nr:polysaccharide biosynthesis tyrosine autokinase [Mediterranea sp.]